jgi:AraC family transcriptional regulator
MNYCESVQKSIDFFEQHLKEDIDINTIVRQSCFSTTHFYRVFHALVGESLKDYIRKRRLSNAAIDLCTSDKRIIDIVYEYGFNSQEVFTRAFSKLFGITPGRYRVLKIKTVLYEKVNTYQKMMLNLSQENSISPRIILDKEFRVIGLTKRVKPGSESIRNLWGEFNSRKIQIVNAVTPNNLLGLCEYMPDATDESEFGYIACVEVDDCGNIPEGMVAKVIPHSKYAVFTHNGPVEELKDTYSYIYGAWLPYSGYELAELDTIELYNSDNNYGVLDIYIPIK